MKKRTRICTEVGDSNKVDVRASLRAGSWSTTRSGRWWRPAFVLAVCGLLVAAGCGDADDNDRSASGAFEGEQGLLVEAELSPDPPRVGEVEMEMELSVDGETLEGADVEVEPWMPAHDHGSNTEAVAHEPHGGHYVVEDLTFSMAGVWELRVTVDWDEGADEVVWDFEVDE